MKTLLIIAFVLFTSGAYGQSFKKQNGLLLFEQVDSLVSETYFVPSSVARFDDLFGKKDTVKALSVAFYSGGCLGENKWLRDTLLRAKALSSYQVQLKQTNHQGLEYLDQYSIYTASGTIKFNPSQGYALGKRFKTIYFQNKKLVVDIHYYQPFNEVRTASLRYVFN